MLYCVIVILASCYMVHTQKRRPPSGSPRRVAVGVLPYSLQDRRKLRKDLREGSPTKGKPFLCRLPVPGARHGPFLPVGDKIPFQFQKIDSRTKYAVSVSGSSGRQLRAVFG